MSRESMWDRWEEIDPLLEQVLDLPESERDAFLDAACGNDRELLLTVRSLARYSEESDAVPLRPDAGLLRAALTERSPRSAELPESLVGATIGAYRLVGVLGVGGMGAVYLGERTDGVFERRVAVKVLHRSLDVDGVLERFRVERQILASLNHPGIAQLIDGGATADGRPFLVMEHVDGIPILRYADEQRLGVDDRIRLILRVADAVGYAHRNMVVHRDLKPSNILVTADGQVKLLDFGIAKLLESGDDAPAPLATRPEARFVTPEYAAPEQLLGQRISTQTDVFALAALLYELLTGVRPYAAREPGSVLERMIRGDEPTAPSVVVAAAAAASAGAALPSVVLDVPATRGTGTDALRRRLSGDLDAILLRGLKTRPEERYESVAALSDDLERHLGGLPVAARGGAALYRARRFVRRHRLPVALAAIAFSVVLGSAVGLAVQRSAVLEERNRAQAASIAASREAETARQVTGFLIDLFRASDPSEARGDSLTVRTLLERGRIRIEQGLSGQPLVRAQLLDALGDVYLNLGVYEESTALFERAVALHRDSVAGGDGLARSLVRLGHAQRVARELRSAVQTFHEAALAARAAGDERSLALAEWGLGTSHLLLNQPDSAETALRNGLERMTTLDDYPEDEYLSAQTSLAGLLRRRNDLPGAEALYRQIAERQRASPATEPMDYAVTLNNLAVVRRMQGAFEDARGLYAEAIDTVTTILGAGHPQSLMLQGNLARVLSEMGRTDDAIAVYRARVAAARTQWPQGHWQVADALMNLGGSLVDARRAEEAVDPLAEAVAMAVSQLGDRHSWTDVYRGWLGTALQLAGREAEGERWLQTSLAGLARYQGLAGDPEVTARIEYLVQRMERGGVPGAARRYRELLDRGRRPQ